MHKPKYPKKNLRNPKHINPDSDKRTSSEGEKEHLNSVAWACAAWSCMAWARVAWSCMAWAHAARSCSAWACARLGQPKLGRAAWVSQGGRLPGSRTMV